MRNKENSDLLSTFRIKYKRHPKVCSFCGKPIELNVYIDQYGQDRFFCNDTCLKEFTILINKDSIVDTFSSKTEYVIYNNLKKWYPNLYIDHNVKDLLVGYEVDIWIPEEKIVIEYNGIFHFNKNSKKTNNKLNDRKKRKMICDNLQYRLVRIWSSVGVFSRPELFTEILGELKTIIDMLLNTTIYSCCYDIVVNINDNDSFIVETYKT